ncbi:MAG: SDR family oxidoreductase [Cyclobacteriaceae bacterium]
MKKLENKVIWITGASSGIGEALAYELAGEKNFLILSARREDKLERVKSQCPPTSQDSICLLPLDLSVGSSIPDKVAEALKWKGHIDVLINNGGISQRGLAKDTILDVDRRIMEVNYFGTIALTKAILPSMIQKRSGHIVVNTSLTGKFSTPLRSSYAASKHALHGFFDALRAELFDSNIKVTILAPGFVKTDITLHALTNEGKTFNQMGEAQASGMDVHTCAQKMIRAIEREKEEVYIGGKEVYAVYLKRFFPGLFSKMVRKAKVT